MPQAILFARRSTNQFTSDDRDNLGETPKIKICGGGLNASQSPPHPPSKKAAILDHSREGFEEVD